MSVVEVNSLRQQFPLFKERNYLATHSLGCLPHEAFLDIEEYKQSLLLGRRALPAWLERYEEIFGLIERLLNAPSGSVALGPSATACQAAIAATLNPTAKQNCIIISELDFPSCRYLWAAQSRRGFQITEAAAVDKISIPAEALVAKIDERVAVVAISLVSYLNSSRIDINAVIAAAHRVGAIVILDAYQAVGLIPLDVTTLDVDVVVGGTHKWLGGGLGLAFAYVRPSLAEQLEPIYPGWFSHSNPTAFESTFTPAPGARRFQQGTPAMEPIYTSRAGLRFALEFGVEQIYQRNQSLTTYLIAAADAYGIKVNTPRTLGTRGGTVCLEVNNPTAVAQELAELGIDVDTRSELGIRVSPHLCSTEEECDRLIESLIKLTHKN
jgi:kynureninase